MKIRLKFPLVFGVPERILEAVSNVIPEGRIPDSDSVGVGKPVADTLNELCVPTENVELFVLVIPGA